MGKLELESLRDDFISVDLDMKRVPGQILQYTDNGNPRAVRVGCGRSHVGCAVFLKGKCQADNHQASTGNFVRLDTVVFCGQTGEGKKAAGELL